MPPRQRRIAYTDPANGPITQRAVRSFYSGDRLNLVPLVNTPFSRTRSNIKLIETTAFDVPSVTRDFEAEALVLLTLP